MGDSCYERGRGSRQKTWEHLPAPSASYQVAAEATFPRSPGVVLLAEESGSDATGGLLVWTGRVCMMDQAIRNRRFTDNLQTAAGHQGKSLRNIYIRKQLKIKDGASLAASFPKQKGPACPVNESNHSGGGGHERKSNLL